MRQGGSQALNLLRLALALLLPLLIVPVLLTGVVAARVCTEPLDVTSVRQRLDRDLARLRSEPSRPPFIEASALPFSLPHAQTLEEFVDDVLASDVARYWFHAALGRSLEYARCSPTASGLQWLKAAAHAHTPRQVQRATAGLVRDLARSRDPAQTRSVLCAALGGYPNAPQTVVTAAAGLACPRAP